MQTVKNFVYGLTINGDFNSASLEDQINEYLEYHPGYSVAAMSMLDCPAAREALVVFNVREERNEKKPFVKETGDKKVKRND